MRALIFSAPLAPCSSSISPIWRSIVCKGLSEVIGSWKTMVTWAPLISRSRASRQARRSSPLKSTWPRTSAARLSRRTIERAVTDLPEPDSPTRPRVRPRSSVNDTPSTARVSVSPCRKSTLRSRTSRRGASATKTILQGETRVPTRRTHGTTHLEKRLPGVEGVAHGFADENQQRKHDRDDQKAGEAEPRRGQVRLSLQQEFAERRRPRRQAKP